MVVRTTLSLLLALTAAFPQARPAEKDIDQIVWNEIRLIRSTSSVIDLYLQTLDSSGAVQQDAHWLGEIQYKNGTPLLLEFLPPPARPASSLKAHLVPSGFLNMIFPDLAGLDQDFFNWNFRGEQITADTRCWVFDLAPKNPAAHGAFIGSILVAEADKTIVRLEGSFTNGPRKPLPYLHFISARAKSVGRWVPYAVSIDEKDVHPIDGSSEIRARILTFGFNPLASAGQASSVIRVQSGADEAPDQSSEIRSKQVFIDKVEGTALDSLTALGLIARPGEIEQRLARRADQLRKNNSTTCPEIRVRLLLPTALENSVVGCTLLIPKELLNLAPDDAPVTLALAVLVAHVLLNHPGKPIYDDILQAEPRAALKQLNFVRSAQDIAEDEKLALKLLMDSQSRSDLETIGSFLRSVAEHCHQLSALFHSSRIGNPIPGCEIGSPLMALTRLAPRKETRPAAYSLGSRSVLDPLLNTLELHDPSIDQIPFDLPLLDINPRLFVHPNPSDDPPSSVALPPAPFPFTPAVPPLKR